MHGDPYSILSSHDRRKVTNYLNGPKNRNLGIGWPSNTKGRSVTAHTSIVILAGLQHARAMNMPVFITSAWVMNVQQDATDAQREIEEFSIAWENVSRLGWTILKDLSPG